MRDLNRLITTATSHGATIGIYAERILDAPLPRTKMRTVYRLLALVSRYGPGPVNTACGTALDLDVIPVTKIDSMLKRATENTTAQLPTGTPAMAARFARDPAEHASRGATLAIARTTPTSRGTATLTLIRGGAPAVTTAPARSCPAPSGRPPSRTDTTSPAP